jgi:uncharacterized protein (TIGR00369 family)
MPPNPMPVAALLGIEVEVDTDQDGVCLLRIGPDHLNQGLVAHGGVLFTLADTALGLLVNRPGAESTWVGTSFSMQLHRPARVGDTIRASAVVENRSRRLISCRVVLERLPDKALIGTLTNQLLEAPPVAASGPAPVTMRTDSVTGALARGLCDAHDRECGVGDPVGEVGIYLVAEVAGQPVGGAHLWMDDEPGTAYVDRLWVHPGRRGESIEDAVLTAAGGAAAEAGNTALQLTVYADDPVAMRAAARARYGELEDVAAPPGARVLTVELPAGTTGSGADTA